MRPGARNSARHGPSRPLDKTIHHALLAGLVEGDRQLVAVDQGDAAVAEFLVEDAVAGRELRRAGGLCDQLAFDGQWDAVARRAAAAASTATRGKAPFILAGVVAGGAVVETKT